MELTKKNHHFVLFSLNWYGYELWAFVNAPRHVHGTSTASVASAGFESASEGSTAGSLETSLRPEDNPWSRSQQKDARSEGPKSLIQNSEIERIWVAFE